MTSKDMPIGFLVSCLLIIVLLAVKGKADDNDDEPISNIKKLKKDLKAQYDKYARPVKNASTPVPVMVEAERILLVELNEAEEIMVVDVQMSMHWKDEHLRWEPRNYKGIDHLMFPQDEIWVPDIFIYESAPVTDNIPWNKTHVIASPNGDIFWGPPASMRIRCPMASSKMMEERICNITIASYSYFKHELDLKVPSTEMSVEVLRENANPVWKITNVSASLEFMKFDTFDYSIAAFTLRIKRRYDFVSDVLRGPRTVAILLTLAVFWLPSTSDKKLNLGCLVLLILAGIILYLSSTVISSSLLAARVAPLRVTLFTATSALLVEVIIINLSRLSDIIKPSPILVRILSGMVGRFFGVCSRLEYKEDGGMVRLSETEEDVVSQPTITIEEEWALVAMALDRIFFIIYSIIFVIVS